MSYEYKSIKKIMEMIGRNKIYLPAIQRKFVWRHDQIESLFDSIMRGYPIGIFLFWYVKGGKVNEYTFYKFLQHYHQKDNKLNEIAPKPELKHEIIGVLDGQQRLSSMYIALQGTYAYKIPYFHWNNDKAFPEREFYLNLFKISSLKKANKEELIENDTFEYEFKFLTEKEAISIDNNKLWFPVKKVFEWGEDPLMDDYYDDLLENEAYSENDRLSIRKKRKDIKRTLRILHQRLVIEELISFYKIEEQDLDNILDIFVRVNSGGTILSKSDLLFSTIVANWEAGREKFEQFLKFVNRKGEGFWFNTDFLMRSCLMMTDCPVLFKVRSFKKENIQKIKDEWENIKNAISKTVDLLVEFGFNGETLTSQNAIIPISYYFIKGGNNKNKSKLEIRKYLVHSLIKHIFGGHGDTVLSNIREAMRLKNEHSYSLKHNEFLFEYFLDLNLPGGRSFKINEDDIEEILGHKIGAYSFMVLSLLYPQLKFHQIVFHQDHIHPKSFFTSAKLKNLHISEEKWNSWISMKDMLPNLQLLEGRENQSKNNTPFKKWLETQVKQSLDVNKFGSLPYCVGN